MKNPFRVVEQPPRTEKCETHGEFSSSPLWGDRWTRCPRCEEEMIAQLAAQDDAQRATEKASAWKAKLDSAHIPLRFVDRTLESYDANGTGQRNALQLCIEFCKDYKEGLGRCLLFVGKPGTGKTHLAIGIGLALMQRGHTVRYTTVQGATRRIKDTYGKDSRERESDAIREFTSPDLLILDEIGVQFGTDFERNLLFDILNTRYENRKSSILMSNLGRQEVQGYLGERLVDRIREDGGRVLVFDWDSHRASKTNT